MYFKDANYNVGEMHLKNGMIYNEKASGRIGVVIEEHLKNRVEQYSHSNSFGLNFGAMMSFGMTPGLINGMMAVPVDRKSTSSSVHENYAQSGMHIKDNHIEIGEKIEIKPELENQEHLKVRDTAPISSIGSIMAGVQEIKENWEAIQKPHHHDIIIDAEPVENEVIAEAAKEEKTQVIAVDAEPKTPEKQGDFSLRQDELHEIIDEIYDEDIAPYHEFERAGSPDRVETELTKAVGKVQDVANGFVNASDFSNMPDPIIGADSDPQSMVALGKGVMKVAEFAGEIFGTVIEPAANAIGTKVRRVLRDDIGISQAKAQDIGDITHLVAGILIPGGTAKVISKTGKLTSFGKAVEEASILDNINKVPYNPRAMESLFKQSYGAENVVSSTMPKSNAKNVKLAGARHPETDIVFNNRGMPIFDDIAKVEVRITGDLSHMKPEAHKVAATRQLKADIAAGKVDKKLFSDLEMKQIDAEKPKIGEWTWHHHEDAGRMQLVPEGIHKDTGHYGGDALWGMEVKK